MILTGLVCHSLDIPKLVILLLWVVLLFPRKKQFVVPRSSTKVEYQAIASTVSEILWLCWLLKDLEAHQSHPTPIYCDNQAARHIAKNFVFHEHTKHVEIDCFFVREHIESHQIITCVISSNDQVAYIFTKPHGSDRFCYLLI